MTFGSLSFFLFLAVAAALFSLAPVRFRPLLLLAASLAFAASFGAASLGCLLAVIAAGCGAAWLMHRFPAASGRILAGSLLLLIGGLGVAKYADALRDAAAPWIALPGLPRLGPAPPGLSFYIFTTCAALIDLHRNPPARPDGLTGLALTIASFPKLLAGPIERIDTLMPQIAAPLRMQWSHALPGLQLFLLGLIKKVVIADNLAPVVDHAFHVARYAQPMELLIAVYFFAFQIYGDFSGYSDMAVGISLLFGIVLSQNFRQPYLSRSPAEFWSARWHVTLGRWFRDYLYIPLGGSRTSLPRRIGNIMLVFMVSGLWHAGLGYGVGWTFLLWGALNGLYQSVQVILAPAWRRLLALIHVGGDNPVIALLQIVLTFHLILVGWIFFRAESVEQALTILRRLAASLPALPAVAAVYPYSRDHLTGFVLIAGLLLFDIFNDRVPLGFRLWRSPSAMRWDAFYAAVPRLLTVGRWRGPGFIYMQF